VRTSRKAKRIRIEAPWGTAEFMAEYHAALAGEPRRKQRGKLQLGSLEWLVWQFRQSSAWSQARPATQRQWANILDRVCATAGSEPFAAVTAKDVLVAREARRDRPAAANNFLKAMRKLFAYAMEHHGIEVNPAAGVKLLALRGEGHATWTAEDLARYRARWPLGTRQRAALEFLLVTGLRRGDAVRAGRQHVRDGLLQMKAEKTGAALFVPFPDELGAVMDQSGAGGLAFITGADGRPMTKESFGNSLREWCRAAGVNKSAHGLRKAAATGDAENGATELELQAKYGWLTNSQSAVYTRAASREAMARALAEKQKPNRYSLTDNPVRESGRKTK
jgi:integrase